MKEEGKRPVLPTMIDNDIFGLCNWIKVSPSFLVLLVSLTDAIRVDWNTNQGPIVPPVPTQQPRPQPPYREPAPVWEDQSDDIPNPNTYRYILPPPSRPRPSVDNYLRAPLTPQQQQQQQQPNYGQVISNGYNPYKTSIVPSLGVQYIPNFGYKYSAVVPQKSYYLRENDLFDDKFGKQSERYNAKLKKYKAYEKLKYLPQNYYQLPNQYQFAIQPDQNLPYLRPQQPFRRHNEFHYLQQQKLQALPLINATQQNFAQQKPQQQQQKQHQQQQQQQQQQLSSLQQTAPQTFAPPVQQTSTAQNTQTKENHQNSQSLVGNNNKLR